MGATGSEILPLGADGRLPQNFAALTNERLLRRNVGLNLAAWIIPALTALVAIPMLAHDLGAARFGLVSISWTAIGVFSLFDFGVGRSLSRMIAERVAHEDTGDIPDIVWTASWTTLGIGVIFAIIGFALSSVVATRVLLVPTPLHNEATAALRWIAIGIPFMAHGVVLRGVLEAVQRFGASNRLRIPLGVVTYGGPLLVLPFHGGAAGAVAIIVAGRVLYWAGHFPAIDRVQAGLSRPRRFSPESAHKLWHAGGWIAVSSVISPFLYQTDRLAIALLLPIAASGWYSVATEVATKQWLFSAAIQPVLFAALTATLARRSERAVELMRKATRATMGMLFPVALSLVILAAPGLRLWMRGALALPSVDALRWLAAGVFVNAAAQVPYAALQAGADARAPSVLQLVEFPIYALLLFVLVRSKGIEGAAIACAARMVFDNVALWFISGRRVRGSAALTRQVLIATVAAMAILAVAGVLAAYVG